MIQLSPEFLTQELQPDIGTIAADAGDAVFLTTPDGRLEWINRSFTLLFGYTLEETAGRRPFDFLVGPESQSETLEQFGCEMACQSDFCHDIAFYNKAGCERWVSLRATPAFDSDSRIKHYICVARDITEYKDLEAENAYLKERLAQLLENGEKPE